MILSNSHYFELQRRNHDITIYAIVLDNKRMLSNLHNHVWQMYANEN